MKERPVPKPRLIRTSINKIPIEKTAKSKWTSQPANQETQR